MSSGRRRRAPSLLELPPSTLEAMCLSLDSGTVHSWRSLVNHLADYTVMDVRQLIVVEQKGESASGRLLRDLNSRGWTVVDLAELARKADALEVVQILADYCKAHRPDIELPESVETNSCPINNGRGSDTPITSTSDRDWKSAKSCFHRSSYPTSISPPVGAEEEAKRRYGTVAAAVGGATNGTPLVGDVGGHGQNLPGGSLIGAAQPEDDLFTFPYTAKQSSHASVSESNQFDSPSQIQSPSRASDATVFSLESLPVSDLAEVPYQVLEEASNHFDQVLYENGGHMLGSGGFGEVFHCLVKLPGFTEEREVAIKALLTKAELFGCTNLSSASMESTERRQFVTEIQALSNLSHTHLLPVLGYSCDGPRLCLVYPFMPNGSLDTHLRDTINLTPEVRVQVACDVSLALAYLHTGTDRVVIHRDVKSANILLTGEWRGTLGDFGVARSLPSTEHTSLHTTTVVGTRVYMAHEFSQGTVSPAADTYAFGVVLFELLTGYCAQNSIKTNSGEDTDLISFIDECDDVDELMGDEWAAHKWAWQSLWALAESCVEHIRKKRPSSSKVSSQIQQTLQRLKSQTQPQK